MCFRPSTIEIDGETELSSLEYRAAAYAKLDAEEHISKEPIIIDTAKNITWEVEEDDDDIYVVSGTVEVPIEIRLRLDRETKEFSKTRVTVLGRRIYDERTTPEISSGPYYGADSLREAVEARANARKNASAK